MSLSRWLDRSIVLSFDRTGFRRHQRRFREEPERDLDGQDVLVTGGTSGIGFAAARALGDRGARPLLWARDPERGSAAAAAVSGVFEPVDLGDLRAVSAAAHGLQTDGLAAVVLNAGAMPLERRLTPQGHELVWSSQVLGHLLILRILRERGLLGPATRVIWVSSGGMYAQRLDLRDLRCDRGYQRHTVYANAKRAQVELNAWLAEQWGLTTAAMHPGWVDTEAVRHSMPWFRWLTAPILRAPEEGADTLVWLVARAEAWPTGRFWFDRRPVDVHLSSRSHTRPGDTARLVAGVLAATDPFLEPV